MDWTRQIDAYCERVGPAFWAEPLNAASNLAFLVAALVIWRRVRGAPPPYTRTLILLLVLIGVASAAWHTLAQAWTGAADSLSIAVFVMVFLYAANRRFHGMGPAYALAGTAAFLPYAALTTWLMLFVPVLRHSASYWPVALLIAGYAATLFRRAPDTARRLTVGAALLAVSITLRSLDGTLCSVLPIGTHFLWHLLNAVMLGYMIDTLARHDADLAARPARR